MSAMADKLRQMAAEQRAASAPLLDQDKFDKDPKMQALFIIGQVSGNVFEAVADAVQVHDILHPPQETPMQTLRRRALEKAEALRKAAAHGNKTGDWHEFDRLAAGESNS